MSPLSQARLLLPLLEAIRALLGPGEHATLTVSTQGAPHIVARTERGSLTASINDDGMYAFDTPGGLYACDTNSKRDDVYDMIRTALNDAREAWT